LQIVYGSVTASINPAQLRDKGDAMFCLRYFIAVWLAPLLGLAARAQQPTVVINDLFVLASGSWEDNHNRAVIVCTHLESKSSTPVPVCFLNEASIMNGKPYLDANLASVTTWTAMNIEATWTLNLDSAGNNVPEERHDAGLTHLKLTLSLDLKTKMIRRTMVATQNGRSATTVSHLVAG
jgi:hypothetical protein